MVKNECRWVRMDGDVCNGVYGYGGREKTRQKETEMDDQVMFWHARQWQKKHRNSTTKEFGEERGCILVEMV